MFPFFADVPGYPLVFLLFWGATVFFALAMARHLRVFAAARAQGPSLLDNVPVRLWGLIRYAFIQTRMVGDTRAAVLHWGIFWGFILLTIGTANIVTGGLVQAVISIPFDGFLWVLVSGMQNVVAVLTIAAVLWAFERRLISRPARLTLNNDALIILSMIGGLVAAELFAQVFEAARYGDVPGAFIADGLAAPLRANVAAGAPPIALPGPWGVPPPVLSAFLLSLPPPHPPPTPPSF